MTALADFGFEFDRWSDGSAENPRTLTAVHAVTELTAWFRAVESTPYLAALGADAVAQGQGLWDVTHPRPPTHCAVARISPRDDRPSPDWEDRAY